MARPKKNYCDYFPHDRDMRNHRKVKAIRTKFGPIGYAIWSMTLEYLTGIDGNVFEYSDVEFELMAGDFGVSAPEIRNVLDYCIKMEMIFLNNGFINSDSLDERLKPVYEKRGTSKDKSNKQHRINGKFASNNTVDYGVSVTESTQKKVNKIKLKENKIKEEINFFWEGDEIVELWNSWKEYKMSHFKFKYKTIKSEQFAFDSLLELSTKNIEIAKEIVKRSMVNGWKGLFLPPKSQNKTLSPNFDNKYQDQVNKALKSFKTIEHDNSI